MFLQIISECTCCDTWQTRDILLYITIHINAYFIDFLHLCTVIYSKISPLPCVTSSTLNSFTLQDSNTRIHFHYYKSNANEPPLITKNALKETYSVSMSASEVKTFLLNFGLIVEDLVPVDDEYWQIY